VRLIPAQTTAWQHPQSFCGLPPHPIPPPLLVMPAAVAGCLVTINALSIGSPFVLYDGIFFSFLNIIFSLLSFIKIQFSFNSLNLSIFQSIQIILA
jgi:hypothetical protein